MRGLVEKVKRISKKRSSEMTTSDAHLDERIQKKAYEFFEQRGCIHGYDMEDWLRAEEIIRTKSR